MTQESEQLTKERVIYDVFSQELYFQIITALYAKNALLGFPDSVNSRVGGEVPIGFWPGDVFRVQVEDFLLRCANVSRIFFNSYAPRRNKVLCDLLKVTDASPIRNTAVRNAMQHHDKDLDKQIAAQVAGNGITAVGNYSYQTNLDGSFEISWYGNKLSAQEFSAIVTELERLKLLLEANNSYLRDARR